MSSQKDEGMGMSGCPKMAPCTAEQRRCFSYWSYPAILACALLAVGLYLGSTGCSDHSSCHHRQGTLAMLMPGMVAALGCGAACVGWMRSYVMEPRPTGFAKALAAALVAGLLLGLGLSFGS